MLALCLEVPLPATAQTGRTRLPGTLEGAAAPRAHLFDVSAAMLTPFDLSGTIDGARAAAHVQRVLASGADGVTLFGTTGEGASLGEEDRVKLYEAVLGAGVAPEVVTACICATSVENVVSTPRGAPARASGRRHRGPRHRKRPAAARTLRFSAPSAAIW